MTRNIQNLVSIKDNDEVTAISWGDEEEKEVLIACGTKEIRRLYIIIYQLVQGETNCLLLKVTNNFLTTFSIKVYDTDYSAFTCSFTCDAGRGSVNGVSRYNG